MRRIAARASTVTHESKMDIVARIAAGADAMGIDEIYTIREPFRIAERALEWMSLQATVHLLDVELTHSPTDTEFATRALIEHGVQHVVSLGGDGTQRIIARTAPDLNLIPLSTGTNNVYPLNIEPTFAGIVAALGAKDRLPKDILTRRSKVAHLEIDNRVKDLALIDIGRIEGDFVGNYRPFKAKNIKELVLTRALPNSIGMSPIGGLLQPVPESQDQGLYVGLGEGRLIPVPLAPGSFEPVSIGECREIDLGEKVILQDAGLIELDGDRLYRIEPGEEVSVSVRRDGPFVYDVPKAMHYIAEQGIL